MKKKMPFMQFWQYTNYIGLDMRLGEAKKHYRIYCQSFDKQNQKEK